MLQFAVRLQPYPGQNILPPLDGDGLVGGDEPLDIVPLEHLRSQHALVRDHDHVLFGPDPTGLGLEEPAPGGQGRDRAPFAPVHDLDVLGPRQLLTLEDLGRPGVEIPFPFAFLGGDHMEPLEEQGGFRSVPGQTDARQLLGAAGTQAQDQQEGPRGSAASVPGSETHHASFPSAPGSGGGLFQRSWNQTHCSGNRRTYLSMAALQRRAPSTRSASASPVSGSASSGST